MKVDYVRSTIQLRAVYSIEQAEYPSDSIPNYETVLAWWNDYPNGVIFLEHNGGIVGALGLWPLQMSAFNGLSSGQMTEGDITQRHIIAAGSGNLQWWYVADIILKPEFRGTRMALKLLREALALWLGEAPLADSVHCVALAYSTQGKSLLEKMGFQEGPTSPDQHPVYICSASAIELRQKWSALFGSKPRNG